MQGAEELDKLVYIMTQNKDLKIFVKSHTDFRGNEDYNMRLSNHRSMLQLDISCQRN
jgi:outer membrane protein OmpA-like peptidoglycan-associated protein